MMDSRKLRSQREYAWNYFQLHAAQRMAAFNFFVVLSALLTGGLAASLNRESAYSFIGLVLGLSLITISFVFWKLDQRVRYLIKHAETTLKEIESCSLKEGEFNSEHLGLFLGEETKTEDLRGGRSWNPCTWHFSYYQCFGVVYIVFAVIGVVGIIAAVMGMIDP